MVVKWLNLNDPVPVVFSLLVASFALLGCQDNSNANSNNNGEGDQDKQTSEPPLVESGKVTVKIGDTKHNYRTAKITVNKTQFQMKLALDESSRLRGLGKMTEKQIGQGMLFAFPDPQVRGFVMRDCPKPIDIVFVNSNGLITAIHKMMPEPANTPEYKFTSYSSRWPSVIAMEFIGGTLDTLELKVGQKLDLPIKALKRIAK